MACGNLNNWKVLQVIPKIKQTYNYADIKTNTIALEDNNYELKIENIQNLIC